VPKRWLAAFLIALVLPWAVVALAAVHVRGPRSWQPLWGNAKPDAGSLAKPGPWGELQVIPITISSPIEFVQELGETFHQTKWHWRGLTRERLTQFFQKAGVTPDQLSRLQAATREEPGAGRLVIDPPAEVVRELSTQARKAIYGALSHEPANVQQMNAFRIPTDVMREAFDDLELPADAVALVKKLCFPNGSYSFFADLPLVKPLLPEPAQQQRLMKAITTESSLLLRLRLTKESDLAALADYWGRGGRGKDIQPLLESLARLPGGQSLDVVHLLPGFARRRIYNYPEPSTDPVSMNRDCLWTAMNFFQAVGDEIPAVTETLQAKMRKDYFPIHAQPLLGDLVLLSIEGRTPIHAAVYIADDIVFTKNGSRTSSPWTFCKISEIRDYYLSATPLQVTYFRRRDM
jgi:hypothetical protein